MKLKLMISDRRTDLLNVWAAVFRGVEEVTFASMPARMLMKQPIIDAELMLGWFAHERYGGKPELGESQILSTRGEPDMPSWVITTVPFAASHKTSSQPDGPTKKVVAVFQGKELGLEEEIYILFKRVFERIQRFNSTNEQPKIQTLGFDLEFLCFPQGDPRTEAEAVQRAYLEQDRAGAAGPVAIADGHVAPALQGAPLR